MSNYTDFIRRGGDTYVDRGDCSDFDFGVGDFITDNDWHDLDLSSIVPVGANLAHVLVRLKDDLANSWLMIREKGNTTSRNALLQYTPAVNVETCIDGFITLDSNRVIEYRGSNTAFTEVDLVVRGWIIPGSVTAGGRLISRGDPADYDWTEADLTMNNNYHDLDLSSIVPEGATGVLMAVAIRDSVINTFFGFKPYGNVNGINSFIARIMVANTTYHTTCMMPLDSNRKLEYICSAPFDNVYLCVMGWFI